MKNVQELSRKGLVRALENMSLIDIHCDSCSVSKSTKALCKKLGNRQTKNVLELIHSDLCDTDKIYWQSKVLVNIHR